MEEPEVKAHGDVDVGILEALADEEHGGLCAVACDEDLPGHPGGGGQIVGVKGLVVLMVVVVVMVVLYCLQAKLSAKLSLNLFFNAPLCHTC